MIEASNRTLIAFFEFFSAVLTSFGTAAGLAMSQRIPRRRQIGILFGGNPLCAFASWSPMRRMLKTTNATPQKYSSEGVSISRRRTFRRIESPPHSAINIYVRNDIEKNHQAIGYFSKDRFDKSIVKNRFRALLKRHLT